MQLKKTSLKWRTKLKHKIPLICILCLLTIYISAQRSWSQRALLNPFDVALANNYNIDSLTPKKHAEVKKINIRRAAMLDYRDSLNILIDSVQLEHEGAILTCDSAYFNPNKNTFEAFSNVEMNQGDTLFLYGDYMEYNGNTQLVKMRMNVKMEHNSGNLFTDSLNFDRIKNIGYYMEGGNLVDSINILNSLKGYYEPSLSLATFIKDVELINDNFHLYSDTLLYNTKTQIAQIVSSTKIVSDSGIIYGNRGTYDTKTEDAILLDASKVVNTLGNRILIGDSIVYKKGINNGEVFGNMFLQDTIQKVILKGDYGIFYGDTDYAFATLNAEMITYTDTDSLYLHADTLEMIKLPPQRTLKVTSRAINDSVLVYDSIYTNESPMRMNAFHNARFYRTDLQGVCDSLVYNSADSLLRMYKNPVLWSDASQISGDTILILLNDSTVDRMYVKGGAFSIEHKRDKYYNQLKARMLTMYMQDGKLKRVYAEGNVESMTYPEERDGQLNRVQSFLVCSFLNIDLKDGAFDRLKAWPKPTGKATPFSLIAPDKLYLEYFNWYDYLRPKDKEDIFREVEMKTTNERPRITISDDDF